MADSRYAPIYPPSGPGRHSPTYNPARLSMPTVPSTGGAPSQYSLYSGPMPIFPPPHPPAPQPHHHHQPQHTHLIQHSQPYDHPPSRRQTNPQQTTAASYQPTQDPVARSSSVRQLGSNPSSRSRRSSTIDSTSQRPIIVTTSGSGSGNSRLNAPSSHTTARSGDRSPTRERELPRPSEDQYYAQPASSIRSRSNHRPVYSPNLDKEDLARIRDRGDPRLLEPLRPGRGGGPIYSSLPPRHAGPQKAPKAPVPEEDYEYYRPSDLVRYDLEHARPLHPPATSRHRRESVDRGAYPRPSVFLNSGYDRSRPPPTTRGLDRINRGVPPQTSAGIYDAPSVRMPVPPAVPHAPHTESRRSASSETKPSSHTRRERPASMYHDERHYRSPDPYYVPPRERDRHHHERRDADREYERRPDGLGMFRDDDVTSRGFGIRTEEGYDSTAEYRRPEKVYVEMPPEPSKRSDESPDPYDVPERDERVLKERTRVRGEDEQQKFVVKEKNDEKGFRHRVSSGLSSLTSAVGFSSSGMPDKIDKDDRDDDRRRGRSLEHRPRSENQHKSQSRGRSASRNSSRSPSWTRTPSRSRSRSAERDDDSRKGRSSRPHEPQRIRSDSLTPTEEELQDRERHRHDTEARLTGGSPNSSTGELTPSSDTEKDSDQSDKRKSRTSFRPNDPVDLLAIKTKIAELDKDHEAVDYHRLSASPDNFSPEKGSSPVLLDKPVAENQNEDHETRGRELVPVSGEKEKQVRVVSPPRDKPEPRKLKGILKQPTESFPEDPNPVREGVAPHKDDKTKKDAPPGARWTKIRRDIVNPEALESGKERFEVRDNFVIVLRVLNKEEIEQYAYATQLIRGMF